MIRENEYGLSPQEDWKIFPTVNGRHKEKETMSKGTLRTIFWQMLQN
jgi:hypothetical protein